MPTTIAVKESTLQLLNSIKERINANNLDETIIRVIAKAENIPNSRFGSQPRLKPFTKAERADSHEL